MKKQAFEVTPNLLRLALGIPGAAAGGLYGYLTTPKDHRLEGVARGAGIGYMGGSAAGLGAILGESIAPTENTQVQNLPYAASGGLAGGLLGLGVGKIMQGVPPWEQRRKFREELLATLHDEQDKLRKELKGHSPVSILQKMSREEQPTFDPYPGIAVSASKQPVKEKLRNAAAILATAAGGTGGSVLSQQVTKDPGLILGGGMLGGLLSYLAANKLLRGKEKQALSPVMMNLLQAKELSDKREYTGKHAKLRALIKQYPDDFYIDSIQGGIVGITHKSGFRVHAPLSILPVRLRELTNGTEARVA